MDTLIPGLIDDLGRECLIRVPVNELPTAALVCKTWSSEIHHPEFTRQRKAAGVARKLMVLAQAQSQAQLGGPSENIDHDVKQHSLRPTYGLVVVDPGMGTWVHLPRIPGLSEGLPMFCGLVGFGSNIVVVGGLHPVTCEVLQSVYVYSFLSGTWRRGEDMPGVRRSFFGCDVSSSDRMVLVVGGHDEGKNALKSAMLYDVDEYKWVQLPDMNKERDECKVVFNGGMFHVISGYPTYMQGRFERSTEAFDLSTRQWDPVVEEFLDEGSSMGTCVTGFDGRMYCCIGSQNNEVVVWLGDKWQVIAEVHADVRSSQWVTSFRDELVVIGSSKLEEPHVHSGYKLDLKNIKWSKIDIPDKFNGHVQCGCVIEI